jgi:endonuclease-3
MVSFPIAKALQTLRREYAKWNAPVVTFIALQTRDPFRVLISCILSLRTKDETTGPASRRLFALADTPEKMLRLKARRIERAIYPVGFYRNKARVILGIAKDLIEKFGGKVPDDLDALLSLKGVGRKTANLVLTQGFAKHGICVDTHVHRISNRWGYVKTKTPHETERALREKLPRRYWIEYNDLLVAFGQTICKPVSPLCNTRCPIESHCPKIGVRQHR